MRIAIEFWGADLPTITGTCQRADRLGIDAFYYGESPGPLNLDCWTTLAHLAGITDRIRLGPVITNVLPAYRSDLLLAKQAATVALVSGGRLDFRTGAGAGRTFGRPWWEPFGIPYPAYHERLDDLAEALEQLLGLWSRTDHTGGLGLDHPPIPITVAATGPRAIALAHDHAHCWEVSFRTPDQLANLISTHPCPLGECPLDVSLEIDGFLGSTARRVAATRADVRSSRADEDIEGLQERALVGTASEVADQITELHRAGAHQLVVALHDPHDPDALETLAHAAELARP